MTFAGKKPRVIDADHDPKAPKPDGKPGR